MHGEEKKQCNTLKTKRHNSSSEKGDAIEVEKQKQNSKTIGKVMNCTRNDTNRPSNNEANKQQSNKLT